jgi:quinol monooxygenase YgiN
MSSPVTRLDAGNVQSRGANMKTKTHTGIAPAVARTNKLAIGTIEVAPGRRDQLLPLLMAHRYRCLKDEAETLPFEVMAPRKDETKLLLCKVYRDDAAFDTHLNGPSIAQFRHETAGMGVKLSVTRCAIVE